MYAQKLGIQGWIGLLETRDQLPAVCLHDQLWNSSLSVSFSFSKFASPISSNWIPSDLETPCTFSHVEVPIRMDSPLGPGTSFLAFVSGEENLQELWVGDCTECPQVHGREWLLLLSGLSVAGQCKWRPSLHNLEAIFVQTGSKPFSWQEE